MKHIVQRRAAAMVRWQHVVLAVLHIAESRTAADRTL